MALGIPSELPATSLRRAPHGFALGTVLLRAWRRLRASIARPHGEDALGDLDDRLLRDIGVLRERDLGLSREAARDAATSFWGR